MGSPIVFNAKGEPQSLRTIIAKDAVNHKVWIPANAAIFVESKTVTPSYFVTNSVNNDEWRTIKFFHLN